jgi:hypothetical protein
MPVPSGSIGCAISAVNGPKHQFRPGEVDAARALVPSPSPPSACSSDDRGEFSSTGEPGARAGWGDGFGLTHLPAETRARMLRDIAALAGA